MGKNKNAQPENDSMGSTKMISGGTLNKAKKVSLCQHHYAVDSGDLYNMVHKGAAQAKPDGKHR